jgi:transposase
MQVRYQRCCGIDGHKQTIVACVIGSREAGAVQRETRPFDAMTGDVKALSEWLKEKGVTPVARESTGGVLEAGG